MKEVAVFLNHPEVKEALGFSEDFEYKSFNKEFNEAWTARNVRSVARKDGSYATSIDRRTQ